MKSHPRAIPPAFALSMATLCMATGSLLPSALPAALLSALAFCMATGSLLGAEPAKGRTIDPFSTLDPKTTKANGVVAKIVSTPDPQHRRGLELVVDFAIPGAMPNFQKSFPAGLIDTHKYSGIRFFAKSDVATRFSVWLNATDKFRAMNHPDGSPICFTAGCAPASTWTEVILPFEKFGSIPKKEWKNGEQKVYQAGLPIPPEDYPKFTMLMFAFGVDGRGTSTSAQVIIKDLSLVAK